MRGNKVPVPKHSTVRALAESKPFYRGKRPFVHSGDRPFARSSAAVRPSVWLSDLSDRRQSLSLQGMGRGCNRRVEELATIFLGIAIALLQRNRRSRETRFCRKNRVCEPLI
ncbi:MAG: hypothetical protein F6J93_23320 [Oscillatoria sp. SIO1A7]|nr:hypothetical protein [Oscillatoria sp. SIO1A7]